MRALLAIGLLSVAVLVDAATVVLKGGRKVEVGSFEQRGNLIVLRHADGRVESYPLTAVDLDGTRQANQVTAPAAPVTTPTGPHSPFFAARSTPGAAATSVTDADVQMLAPTTAVGEGEATPTPDVRLRFVNSFLRTVLFSQTGGDVLDAFEIVQQCGSSPKKLLSSSGFKQ